MNIVWIEDFGGSDSSCYYLGAELFQSLVDIDAVQLTEWLPEEEPSPETLARYFAEYSQEHRITLVTNVCAFLDRFGRMDICRDVDVFIIDINLAKDDLPVGKLPVPKGFDGVGDFHERAGLFIYNYLVGRRFPKKRICFLTGEDNRLEKFKDQCAELLIDIPLNFHKSTSEKSANQTLPDFRNWLNAIAVDAHYLRLRRGVLNGVDWVGQLIRDDDDALHFREYLDQSNHDRFSFEDALDYLEAVEASLQMDVPACDEHHFLRALLRALAAYWEDRAKANRASKKKSSAEFAIGSVMKTVRNCLSHGNLLDNLVPRDVALLFILNFRAMFGGCRGEIREYESQLLEMFVKTESESRLRKEMVDEKLSENWRNAATLLDDFEKNKRWKVEMEQPRRDGSKVKPQLYFPVVRSLGRVAKSDDFSFSPLVMCMFWNCIASVEDERTKKSRFEAQKLDSWASEVHHRAFVHYFL